MRESLVELVESEGFEAEEASDGAEGLLKVRAGNFACVFLDIRMPRMDGLQLLAKLGEENLTGAPIVVISAFGESNQTIEAMRLGAFDYITKHFIASTSFQFICRRCGVVWRTCRSLLNFFSKR